MGIRRNILHSLIFHAAIITTVFALNFRGTGHRAPEDYIVVSLLKEVTGITSIDSQDTNFTIPQNEIALPEPALSDKTRFFVRQRQTQTCPEPGDSSASPQNDIRRRDDKGEEAHNDIPTQHSLLNTVSENSKDDKTISAGQHAGISGEILFSQGTGFPDVNTQPKDDGNSSLLRAIRASIERAKSYPFLARKRGIEGTVLLSFKIDRKGSPKDIRIIKSSGYQILDEEIPKMLRRASPFPEVKGEIVIPITFKLKESMLD